MKKALAGVIGVGFVAASKGVSDMWDARSIAKKARVRHSAALDMLEIAQVPVHERVAEYGRCQLRAVTETLGSFADWIERNEMAVNRLAHDPVEGVQISVAELPDLKNEIRDARRWVSAGLAGGAAAAVAPQAAMLGVSSVATASTGAAIASLNGAAATNATLAWLGGGSLASGGGGVAAGQAVLGLVAAAPAVFVGGIAVAVVGSKQKTSARVYAADIDVACQNIQAANELLPRIHDRISELSDVLRSLDVRAAASVEVLDSLDFDRDRDAAHFAETLQLSRAIREVVNTPVLDEETGELTDVSLKIVRKYQ